jgi:hypothetical protein
MSPDPIDPLAALTHERCTALVGAVFRMQLAPDRAIDLTLAEAKKLGGARPGRRAPFSLIFRPADPQFYAPQQIYPTTHPELGTLDLFLVPIRPDAAGARFEAVFT